MDLGHPDVEYFTGLQNIWETYFVLESEYSEQLGDAATTGDSCWPLQVSTSSPLADENAVFCICTNAHGFSPAPWIVGCDS